MHDVFEHRVRAAAVAGWWLLLIIWLLLLLSWGIYLVAMSTQPAWLLGLLGPGVDWVFVQNVWFWALVAFKLCGWLFAMVVIWLTLWAHQLRKHARAT